MINARDTYTGVAEVFEGKLSQFSLFPLRDDRRIGSAAEARAAGAQVYPDERWSYWHRFSFLSLSLFLSTRLIEERRLRRGNVASLSLSLRKWRVPERIPRLPLQSSGRRRAARFRRRSVLGDDDDDGGFLGKNCREYTRPYF